MIAVIVEIGPELRTLGMGTIALGGSWLGTRKVRRELNNNGGSTLRDAVDRIEAGQTEILARLDEHAARQENLETPGS